MGRITKAIALDIADQLTQPYRDEIDKLDFSLREHAEKIHRNTIPFPVLEVYGKFKEYFKQSIKSANFSGPGINRSERINFNNYQPYSTTSIELNAYQSGQVVAMLDEINDKKYEFKKLHSDIENSLIALRTYKNVETEFPEAFALLPKQSINTSLIVDLKNVRCKLNPKNCE